MNAPPSSPPPFFYCLLLSTLSYGKEYPFGQFGSAVLAMSLPDLLPTPWPVEQGWRDSPDAVGALLSTSQIICVLSALFQLQMQSTAP